MANALPVESAPAAIARSGLWARLQSSISIGVVLVVIVALAYEIGAKIHNLNATRAVGVFAVGVVSFFGTLSLAHRSSPNTPYDSSEVRLAVTAAFMMVYFAALGIFLFSINTVGSFGQNLMNNMTSLFGVVVGFYFASSAVVEYSRSRERERTGAAPAPVLVRPRGGGSVAAAAGVGAHRRAGSGACRRGSVGGLYRDRRRLNRRPRLDHVDGDGRSASTC